MTLATYWATPHLGHKSVVQPGVVLGYHAVFSTPDYFCVTTRKGINCNIYGSEGFSINRKRIVTWWAHGGEGGDGA